MYNKRHIIEEHVLADGDSRLTIVCQRCRGMHQVTVGSDALEAWAGGEPIQNAMPDLSEDNRELLISGTCPKCWEELFG